MSGVIALAMGNNGVPPWFGSAKATCVSSGYVGPGDLGIPTPAAWWGLRSFSAASCSTRVVNVCNVSDVACVDMVTDATGKLVIPLVGGSDCSMVVCTIKILYDKVASFNLTGASIAVRPRLLTSCIGSLPCLTCTSPANTRLFFTGGFVLAQPYTTSGVIKASGGFVGSWTAASSQPTVGGGISSANTMNINAGTNLTKGSIANGAFHAMQNVFNSTTSSISADGSTTTGNAGTGAPGSNPDFCQSSLGNSWDGSVTEVGWWSGAFSGANITAMNSNQHAFWGF
jgi:hypothetical protein